MRRAALAVLVLALAMSALAWHGYRQFLEQPLAVGSQRVRLQVDQGDSVRAVVTRLENLGVTQFDWRWRLLLRLEPVTIQVGEYWLEPDMRPRPLLHRLESGNVIQYRFTIVEGWTYRQLRAALLDDAVLASEPGLLGEDEVMQELGSGQAHPEGWFLPETYAYVRGDSALDLLGRAHVAMREALDAAWQARSLGLPLDGPYQLLTLASIVEKESSLVAERPEIAGVFTRRLGAGWRLETDPTVIYGLGGDFDGDIRRSDLRTDTPYNTYTRQGLPPTPIAMPSRASIFAAANPAEGTAMFFVADGSGGHVFSDTLDEHNAAVRRMLESRLQERSTGQGN